MNDNRWNRLATAILLQAVRDWRAHNKELKNIKKRDIAMRELKSIIDFINSEWFLYLTNGDRAQLDYCRRLIQDVESKKDQKELTAYMNKSHQRFIGGLKYGH